MIYGRKTQKTYPGRGVVLAVQALLVLGIAYFGIEALANIFDKAAPADATYVITTRSYDNNEDWQANSDRPTHQEYADYYYSVGVNYLDTGEPALALVRFATRMTFWLPQLCWCGSGPDEEPSPWPEAHQRWRHEFAGYRRFQTSHRERDQSCPPLPSSRSNRR